MEITIGLVGALANRSESSAELSKVLLGCQVLHNEYGLGTVRAIDAATQRCQIKLDKQDVTVFCSMSELFGGRATPTVYVKAAPMVA
mgnify:FL=1